MQDLIEIGKQPPKNPSDMGSGFGVTHKGTIGRNERAVEIGTDINEIGGETLMKKTHQYVKDEAGPLAAREPEAVWGGIGSWRA